jgi:hypothetical protein
MPGAGTPAKEANGTKVRIVRAAGRQRVIRVEKRFDTVIPPTVHAGNGRKTYHAGTGFLVGARPRVGLLVDVNFGHLTLLGHPGV